MVLSKEITDRETVAARDEAKLLDLQKICRYTSECSPLPTVAAEGLTHIVLYANPAFCVLVGKEQEELTGRPFAEAVPEGIDNSCIALLDRVYRTGITENLDEQEHSQSRTSPVYWSYSVWAVREEESHPVGVMIQVAVTTETAVFRQQVIMMNQALLLSNMHQHELRETAEELSRRLQLAIEETHHRIKNNLQVVSALVEIQIDGKSPTVPVSALQRIATHVHALADLHDLLTRQVKSGAEGKTLNAQDSLTRLISLLQTSIGKRAIHHHIANVMLSIKQSSALSLIVSEMVSNAFKHGAGDITISLIQEGKYLHLTASDKGRGFPPDFDPEVAAHTGLEIIMSLARHGLHGTIQFTNNPDGGACIRVVFLLYTGD